MRVFNDRGSFEGLAELSEDLMPGLVMANVGYWPSLNRSGTSVNSISSDKHCTFGQAGSYSDNLVEVAIASGLTGESRHGVRPIWARVNCVNYKLAAANADTPAVTGGRMAGEAARVWKLLVSAR